MRHFPLSHLVLASLLSLLTACGTKKTEETSATTTAPPVAAAPTTPAETVPATAGAVAPAATFDINSVPVSSANLGRFPYLSKLPGYQISDSTAFDFDRTYVYDGKNIFPVEGHVLRRLYKPVNYQKQTSALMIERNYDNLLKSLGGVQVAAMAKVPYDTITKFGEEEYRKRDGGIHPSNEVAAYVIRQKDKQIWVQVSPDESSYVLNVTETAAMPQQATTLPAAELKKN